MPVVNIQSTTIVSWLRHFARNTSANAKKPPTDPEPARHESAGKNWISREELRNRIAPLTDDGFCPDRWRIRWFFVMTSLNLSHGPFCVPNTTTPTAPPPTPPLSSRSSNRHRHRYLHVAGAAPVMHNNSTADSRICILNFKTSSHSSCHVVCVRVSR
jgi:hypothetical protein